MESKKEQNKRVLIFGVMLIAVLTVIGGTTYAFFAGNFGQTQNEAITVKAGTMELTFSDLEGASTKIEKALEFGDTIEKTFQIKNTGTLDTYAKISWDDLVNEFKEGSLTYTLEYRLSTEENYEPVETIGTNVPTTTSATKETLADSLLISSGKTYIYKLTITYNNLDEDQTSDIEAHFATKFTLDEGNLPLPSAKETLLAKTNDISITNYEDGNKGEMFALDHPGAIQTMGLKVESGTEMLALDNKVETRTIGWTVEERRDYRYIGNTPNNWIKFNDEDWRIIGIFTVETEDGEKEQLMKIIRNESIGNLTWNSNYINDWSTATLQILLNEGDYYNRSGDYASIGLNEEARNKIENVKWYLGGSSTYYNLGGPDYYEFERGTTVYGTNSTNIIQKVGLMYPSDYVYTYANGVNNSCYTSGYNCSTASAGWLYNPYSQWTQSPCNEGKYYAFTVSANVSGGFAVYDPLEVRPCVYLSSEVKIVDGDGSSGNAYIIR